MEQINSNELDQKVMQFYEEIRTKFSSEKGVSAVVATCVNSLFSVGAFGNSKDISSIILNVMSKDKHIFDEVMEKLLTCNTDAIELIATRAITLNPQILANILKRINSKIVAVPADSSPEQVTEIVSKHLELINIEQQYGKTTGEA